MKIPASILISAVILGLLVSGCAQKRKAVDDLLVVAVSSDAMGFRPSDRLSSDIRVLIDIDQSLIVADQSGQIHEIAGPFSGTIGSKLELPEATQTGEQIWQAVQAYVGSGIVDQSVVPGATRSSAMSKIWELELTAHTTSDTHCLSSTPTVRISKDLDESGTLGEVSFIADGAAPVSVRIPPTQTATLVASKLFSPTTYDVRANGASLMSVEFKFVSNQIPERLGLDLLEAGCETQFERYLEALRQ